MTVAAVSPTYFMPVGTAAQVPYPETSPTPTEGRRRRRRKSVLRSEPQVIRGPWPTVISNAPTITPDPYDLEDETFDRDYVSYSWAKEWDCEEDQAYVRL